MGTVEEIGRVLKYFPHVWCSRLVICLVRGMPGSASRSAMWRGASALRTLVAVRASAPRTDLYHNPWTPAPGAFALKDIFRSQFSPTSLPNARFWHLFQSRQASKMKSHFSTKRAYELTGAPRSSLRTDLLSSRRPERSRPPFYSFWMRFGSLRLSIFMIFDDSRIDFWSEDWKSRPTLA